MPANLPTRIVLCTSYLVLAFGCARFQNRLASCDPDRQQGKLFASQGMQAAETGKWHEAQQFLKRAVEVSPGDAATHRHLAEALWNNGDQPSAITEINRACQLEPNDARTLLRAGEMLLATGAAPAAIDRADQVLALEHCSGEAWALRGRAHLQLGAATRAQADLERALAESPNCAPLMHDLALAYRDAGAGERFLSLAQQLVDQHPRGEQPAELLALEGEAYLAVNRVPEAIDTLRLAANAPQATADTWCLLSSAETAAGRPELALAAAQQAVAVDGSHPRSRELLARLSQEGGRMR
jgi:tetratricopeptide (TPR) repeat protein